MATVLYDRVKENCTATGTGDITLTGALDTSLDEYADRYADGEVVPYCMVESATAWEVGEGAFTLSGTLIARTAGGVISSSNADGLVTFGVGSKECFASLNAKDIASLLSRLSTAETNVALLHFYRATDQGLAVQNMVDGFSDVFTDESGVQAGYVATYDEAGDFYSTKQSVGDLYLDIALGSSTSISAQDTGPKDVFLSPDGLNLFVMGIQATGEVHRYTLTTAWDVSGGKTFQETYSFFAQFPDPVGVFFKPDGLKMFICSPTAVGQFTLSTAWDLSSTVTFINSTSLSTNMRSIYFKPDGTKIYTLEVSTNKIRQFTLTIAWDVAGGDSSDGSYDIPGVTTTVSFAFMGNGLGFYVLNLSARTLQQYDISSAWDVTSTVTKRYEKDDAGLGTTPEGVYVSADGLRLYTISSSADTVQQFDLPAPWLMGYQMDGTKSVAGVNCQEVIFDPTGLKMYVMEATLDRIKQYDLTAPWDVTTGVTEAGTFSVTSRQTNPTGIALSADGLQLFVVGTVQDEVLHYILTVAWEVYSGAAFAASLDLTATVGTGIGSVHFKGDGLKMYVCDSLGNDITQFSLPSPFKINQTIEGSISAASTTAVFFKPDGTKAYIVTSSATDLVTQYNLSVPWDISTGVTTDGTSSVSAQSVNPTGLAFSSDGSAMFVADTSSNDIYKYRLTVSWDITGGKTHVGTYDTAGFELTPKNLVFSADGSKLFQLGSTGDDVTQVSLLGSWMISNEKDGTKAVPASTQGIFFKSDGFKMYVIESVTDLVTQYTLTTAWDITSGVSTDGTYSVNGQQALPSDLAFSPDGTKLFVCGTSGHTVSQYTLTTAWDITGTVTFNTSYGISGQITGAVGLFFSSDGTIMNVLGSIGVDVTKYTLTTAWDLAGTVTHNGQYDVSGALSSPDGMTFNAAGTTMLVINDARVFRFTLTTAWDVLGTVTFEGEYDAVGFASASKGVFFSADGTKLYLAASSTATQFLLMSAGEPDAANTVDGVHSVVAQTTSPHGLFIDSTGLTMIVCRDASQVYRYTLTTAWDVTSGVTYQGEFNSVYGQANLRSAFFSSDGSKMYLQSTTELKQYALMTALEPDTGITVDGSFSVAGEESSVRSSSLSQDGTSLYIIGSGSSDPIQYNVATPWDLTGTVTLLGKLNFAPVVGSSAVYGLSISADGESMHVCRPDTIYQQKLLNPFLPLDLTGSPETALAQPEIGVAVVLQEDTDAIVLNTDLILSISRDGGTTYTAVVLVNVGDSSTGFNILSGEVDLSSQPAGTSLVYKVEGSSQRLKIHGVSIQWR